jgi:hypothetical protein
MAEMGVASFITRPKAKESDRPPVQTHPVPPTVSIVAHCNFSLPMVYLRNPHSILLTLIQRHPSLKTFWNHY